MKAILQAFGASLPVGNPWCSCYDPYRISQPWALRYSILRQNKYHISNLTSNWKSSICLLEASRKGGEQQLQTTAALSSFTETCKVSVLALFAEAVIMTFSPPNYLFASLPTSLVSETSSPPSLQTPATTTIHSFHLHYLYLFLCPLVKIDRFYPGYMNS